MPDHFSALVVIVLTLFVVVTLIVKLVSKNTPKWVYMFITSLAIGAIFKFLGGH